MHGRLNILLLQWAFKRWLGLQEPASVLFSFLNGFAVFLGISNLVARVPVTYVLFHTWLAYGIVSNSPFLFRSNNFIFISFIYFSSFTISHFAWYFFSLSFFHVSLTLHTPVPFAFYVCNGVKMVTVIRLPRFSNFFVADSLFLDHIAKLQNVYCKCNLHSQKG